MYFERALRFVQTGTDESVSVFVQIAMDSIILVLYFGNQTDQTTSGLPSLSRKIHVSCRLFFSHRHYGYVSQCGMLDTFDI